MNRVLVLPLVGVLSIGMSVGCATKKSVRNDAAPTINKVNELDDMTARNSRDIKDVNSRTQQGLNDVNQRSAAADQKAQQAGVAADQAQQMATKASTNVESLANTVANLDNYRPVAETQVHFGFNKANLTSKAKDALDQLGGEIPNAKNYILVVDGNTDSVGSAEYNYQLSQRRADAVVQYVAQKYNVPAHKIYVIGLGKDKPVAEGHNAKSRAENRRVDVRLMTNINGEAPTSAMNSGNTSAQPMQQHQ